MEALRVGYFFKLILDSSPTSQSSFHFSSMLGVKSRTRSVEIPVGGFERGFLLPTYFETCADAAAPGGRIRHCPHPPRNPPFSVASGLGQQRCIWAACSSASRHPRSLSRLLQHHPPQTPAPTSRCEIALPGWAARNSPHRLVVRTSRCGRDNPGSTPGVDIFA